MTTKMESFRRTADGMKGQLSGKSASIGVKILRLLYVKDLVLALTIAGIGFLGYGVHLLLASILNPAASSFITAGLFALVGFVLYNIMRNGLNGD